MGFNEYFKEVPILETNRLTLRPFTHDDIIEYLSFFSEDDVQKYLGNILVPKDIEDARRWVDNMNGRCLMD
jgi:[ribosomal protein S5]-alanine N-acetyltransferase